MKMEFKNPEILISLFSPEDIVTTSNGNVKEAMGAITDIAGNNSKAILSEAFDKLQFNMEQ